MTNVQKALTAFKFNCKIVVQWGDMDAAQHVNNVTYLRWTETARILFMKEIGKDVSPKDDKPGIILAWHDFKYIFPVTFPDTVQIGVNIGEMGKDHFFLETHLFSERHQKLAGISKQKLVTYNYAQLRKVDVPKDMVQLLNGFKI